jgi:tRNA A-37 threonylcarbamoyl transferase component Bud32
VAGVGGRAVTAVRQRLDDRYEVVRSIGAGGMTRVFEAWDRHERRRVAVKMPIRRFADDRAFVARLEREVTAVAGLAHPNVAVVHEVRWDGRAGFVVAELVDGSSLWDMLAARGSLPPAGAAMVAAQVCVALAAAHAGGLTHGHLTPANVLLCIDGRVKLTDFRLAQAAKPALVAPGPEDDLRALGRCLVVMLTGREQPPGEPVRLGPEVPAELAMIVRRAAGQRGGYDSAGDLGRDLVRFLATVRPGLALPGQSAAALGYDPGDMAGVALSRALELMWSLPAASAVRPPGADPPRGRPAASNGTRAAVRPGAGGATRPGQPDAAHGRRRASRAGVAAEPPAAPERGARGGARRATRAGEAAATPRPGAAGGPPPPAARPGVGGTLPPARRRRLALVAGLAGAWLAVVAVVAVGLPRGGPDRPAASQTAAPPTTAVLLPTTSEPATSTTPSQAPTTLPTTTARAAAPTAPPPPPGSQAGGVPERRTVPGVLGLHPKQATEVLHRAGLRVRVVEVRTRNPGQVQRVVDQDPSAGEVVPAGSVVTVAVATRSR